MLFLIALIGAVLVGLLVWKALSLQRQEAPNGPAESGRRFTGPDDDPDFLRQLDERFRSDDDPPQTR